VVELLRKRGVGDILVIGGGIIPPEAIPELKKKGISEIFGPGVSVKEIAQYIRENVRGRR